MNIRPKFSAAAARMLTVGALIAFAASATAQQNYPNRPVRLVSGYAAGGTTSLVGRLIGQKLTESWGQQFVLDTFDEAGLANFYNHKRAPYGIVAPAGTPKPIIGKLSAEVAKYLAQPEFRDALISLGLDPYLSTPREYADVLKAGMAWNVNTINVLKKKGVKFDF